MQLFWRGWCAKMFCYLETGENPDTTTMSARLHQATADNQLGYLSLGQMLYSLLTGALSHNASKKTYILTE